MPLPLFMILACAHGVETLQVPTEYPTLGAAILAAETGDEIVLADGVYSGEGFQNLDTGEKALTIRSASDDPLTCVIDGEHAYSILSSRPSDGTTRIQGLAFTNAQRWFLAVNGDVVNCEFFATEPVLQAVAVFSGTVTDCWFHDMEGTAVNASEVSIERCVFERVTASAGVVESTSCDSCLTTVLGCVFRNNAGVGIATWRGTLDVRESLFESNGGPSFSDGAIFVSKPSGAATITASVFSGNHGYRGGAIHKSFLGAPLHVDDCLFKGNRAANDGGAIAVDGELSITNSRFLDNQSIDAGAAIKADAVLLANCHFEANGTDVLESTSGGTLFLPGSATIRNCAFVGNGSDRSEATVLSSGALAITNCLFARNTSLSTAGISTSGGHIVNCTFVNNHSTYFGTDDISVFGPPAGGTTIVANCVVRSARPIRALGDAAISIRYSNVRDGWAGEGNVDADPLFVDPASDWRLRSGSPSIDAGDNNAVPDDILVDLVQRVRFVDDPATPDTGQGSAPIADMGAYETQTCTADLDESGSVDVADIVQLLAAWGKCAGCPEDLSGDGTVNVEDLLAILAAWGTRG